ncbi:MAG: sugar phosphate isomerase/epimerase [Verrucomicrobiales bacterium]|nr:sugar phosphate isomerase/epimerase [Verrucomicrobiales bacterium]
MLNRRQFLFTTAVLASPPLTAGYLNKRVKLAVKYQMIEEPTLSVVEKFKLLQEIGFDGTELQADEKIDPAEIEKAIERTGIPVHGIVNAGKPDIIPALELANRLGCSSVLTFAQTDPKKTYAQNFADWQGRIRKALPYAEKSGIPLCVENVRASFLNRAEEMARFIDSFDSPMVKSYFDLGNTITWSEQSAGHWAKTLGSRIGKLDIKDRGHAEFGDKKKAREGVMGTNGGEVHWERVREHLKEIEFSGWATAEVAGGDRVRLTRMREWMRDVLDLTV